ncbi:transcriptional regulator [Sporolactobacillus shoreae]|uniref:Transcriptional regulator n=1 Tax=Sporolactobacillus shoreae TaxID=1465501 RepID=A0A4Z0GR70_9BACL|nr:helix-turn-helix domain-containing protein [Sporolactobacillus shoreae]TGA99840.1 transcriptional regulator [Sporolactobacillus shoreae]
MDLQKYLENNYKFEEPILVEELKKELNMNPNTLRQYLKRATDSGMIVRYEKKKGIYYKPNPKAVFKSVLSLNDILKKKYLFDQSGNRMGYRSGLWLANALGLTVQNSPVFEISTNKEKTAVREVKFGESSVFLRKPRVPVNNSNYKLLQVFDLISKFQYYSEYSLEESLEILINYLKDTPLSKKEFNKCLQAYSYKVQTMVLRSGLRNEVSPEQAVL